MSSPAFSSKQRKLSVPRFLNPFSTSTSNTTPPAAHADHDTDGSDDLPRQGSKSARDSHVLSTSPSMMNQFSSFVFGSRRRSSDSPDQGAIEEEEEEEAEDMEVSSNIAPEYCSILSPSLQDPSASHNNLPSDMLGLQRTMSILSTNTLSQVVEGPQDLPHVPYSYRNPTAKQAFYDTHMGSSSGWTSLKGKADTVLRPFGSGNLLEYRRKSGEKASKQDASSPTRGAQNVQPSVQNQVSTDDQAQNSTRQTKSGWSSYLPTDILPHSLTGFSLFSSPSTNEGIQRSDLDIIPVIGPRHPRASHFFNDVKGYNVVILGGYRGSVLRDAKTRQMVWIPLKVGAGLRRPILELGLTTAAEENAEELIEPDETLSRIGKMVDMSSRLQGKLTRKGATVYSWGYDWRLSLSRTSKRLQTFLEELYEASSDVPRKRKGAIVIAHSMGGLVALHALSQAPNPAIFHTLSFGSTPFLGTPNILGPLAYGDAALYNTTICSPRSTFSWRSTFYLLPRDKRCFETESGEKKEVDFLDIKTWEWAGLSPVVRATKRWQNLQVHSSHQHNEGKPRDPSIEADRQHEVEKAGNAHGPSEPPGAAPVDGPSLAKPNWTDGDTHGEAVSTSGTVTAHSAQNGFAVGSPVDDSQTVDTSKRDLRGEAKEEALPSENEEEEVWSYLKKTLQDVRTFDEEILSGFDEGRFERGEYPPITMLTSGRTPTTRGALVGPSELTSDGNGSPPSQGPAVEDWRSNVCRSDYSRMLYGKGDGVITLRSSTAIPGGWKRCLVADDEEQAGEGGGETSLAWLIESPHRHVSLFSDVDGIGRAVWIAMRKKERSRKNL